MSVAEALTARLRGMTRTARMWGSPQELEAAALHFTHALHLARAPDWTWAQTREAWGGPFADDVDEHRAMREKMYGANEAQARVQVVQGFVVVWASLARHPEREAVVGPWLEALLDGPELVETPDRLNMVLFSLMGFVAAEPQAYVNALNLERHRVGGHELRPLPVVAPPGASDAGLTYTRDFRSWSKVVEAIEAALARLSAP